MPKLSLPFACSWFLQSRATHCGCHLVLIGAEPCLPASKPTAQGVCVPSCFHLFDDRWGANQGHFLESEKYYVKLYIILLYVSKLIKAYHTDDKVIQTLALAEKCGINALLCNPSLARIVHKYWNEAGGKIQFISDCQMRNDFIAGAKKSVEYKASAGYCGGELTDVLVHDGKFDIIREGLDILRAAGIPAGIGAHKIETIEGCVKEGIKPDFWMKTVHNWDYWSSMEENPDKIWKDNYFDYNPPRTIEFMSSLGQPWIGFKVLAAGSIKPEVGFKYAFENGADFITVGMYDFQVVDDVNLVNSILLEVMNRKRPWCG